MIMNDEQIKQAAIQRGCIEGTAEYYGFIEGAQYACRQQKCPWISLTEQKPEPKKRVLFLGKIGKAYFGTGNIDRESATIINGIEGDTMTHWMPIPELL